MLADPVNEGMDEGHHRKPPYSEQIHLWSVLGLSQKDKRGGELGGVELWLVLTRPCARSPMSSAPLNHVMV